MGKIILLYKLYCQKIFCFLTRAQGLCGNTALFILGVVVILFGLHMEAMAALGDGKTQYDDSRITQAVNALLTYIEGSFGALILVSAGIGSIMSAAFGQYRAALSLLVVSIGSFILRSLLSTFFNDTGIQP